MKTKIAIFAVMLMMTFSAQSQSDLDDYLYLKATMDPNNAFGIIDNPRTKTESLGLDYDIEAGARWKNTSVYLFYGAFNAIEYKNYGFGVDFHFNWLRDQNIDMTLGAIPAAFVLRKYGTEDDNSYKCSFAPAVRGTMTWWFTDLLGATGTAQLQNRPDIDKFAIFEGHLGLVIRFHRPRYTTTRFKKF